VIKNLRFYIKEGSKENREEIMVEESVRTVLKVFQHELNKGISVHIDADPSLRIFSYQSKIYQLWSNIIKNALDAMEGSGNLFVNISGDDREVKVIISNDGPKIPEDILPKIFNKFYTTKDSSTGTGLGLNIVKEIMDVNKGSVSVSSDESLTSFTFIFKN
jgi:signal transduction histidine kinase